MYLLYWEEPIMAEVITYLNTIPGQLQKWLDENPTPQTEEELKLYKEKQRLLKLYQDAET